MSTKKKIVSARERERRARQRAARRQQALIETASAKLRFIIRLPELEMMIARGRTSILADVEAGKFPKPVPLGSRAVGWLLSEVEEWIKQRAAERAA